MFVAKTVVAALLSKRTALRTLSPNAPFHVGVKRCTADAPIHPPHPLLPTHILTKERINQYNTTMKYFSALLALALTRVDVALAQTQSVSTGFTGTWQGKSLQSAILCQRSISKYVSCTFFPLSSFLQLMATCLR